MQFCFVIIFNIHEMTLLMKKGNFLSNKAGIILFFFFPMPFSVILYSKSILPFVSLYSIPLISLAKVEISSY